MIIKAEAAPIIIRFTVGDYTDALHFANQAERDQYDDVQIEAMCQARYDNWLAVINAPRPDVPYVPSDEEYVARIVAMCERHNISIGTMPGDVAMPYTNTVKEDHDALLAYLVANGLEAA
jgi:hypothetical protein